MITGAAPLSCAATKKRWMRFGLKFRSSPLTKNTVSIFAATICSISSEPDARRENFVRRGNTAWISARCSPSRRRTATQSPTAGNWSAVRATWKNPPPHSPSTSPAAVCTA
jgi:hypothetical protein